MHTPTRAHTELLACADCCVSVDLQVASLTALYPTSEIVSPPLLSVTCPRFLRPAWWPTKWPRVSPAVLTNSGNHGETQRGWDSEVRKEGVSVDGW